MVSLKNILDRIVETKKIEIESAIATVDQLKSMPLYERDCISASKSIRYGSGVISEFKRQSPSKGVINGTADVSTVVAGYQKAGASVVSVLTDRDYFGGGEKDFAEARESLTIPLLRKDFIIDPYQVYETKAMGADLMLLIAAILTKEECFELAKLAKEIGLEVLLELHDECELDHMNSYVDLVGINNRNLKSFDVDIDRSMAMANSLPKSTIKVAESGIGSKEQLLVMRDAGFDAFLIGEMFMKTEDPVAAATDLISSIKRPLVVKVCGNRSSENVKTLPLESIDMLGFIRYDRSSRYLESPLDIDFNKSRVGVYVNEDMSTIVSDIDLFGFDLIQLHGGESLEYCEELKKLSNIKIIKVFSVDDSFDFSQVYPFETFADLFLFDTKCEQYGGSGVTFDWSMLSNYRGETRFILSGGLGVESASQILELKLDKLYGVDINSKFELSPGVKDNRIITTFLNDIKR